MDKNSPFERLKVWARRIRLDVTALWLATRDSRISWYATAVAAAVAAYALSPIDLIPDFVPILGYLDDLLLVPLGIWAAIKLIPPLIMAELRLRAATVQKPASIAGMVAVFFIWGAAIAVTAWLFWRNG